MACCLVWVRDNVDVSVLQAVAELRKNGLEMNLSFLNYAQSSECRNWDDSSVSYAAGALVVHWGQLSQGPVQRRHPVLTIYRHNPDTLPPTPPPIAPTICRKDLGTRSQYSLLSLSPALLHPPLSLKCVSELLVDTFFLKSSFEIMLEQVVWGDVRNAY